MSTSTIPKAVRSAVCRNAWRLAMTEAYQAIRDDLEQRAHNLLQLADTSPEEVIQILDDSTVVQTPALEEIE